MAIAGYATRSCWSGSPSSGADLGDVTGMSSQWSPSWSDNMVA